MDPVTEIVTALGAGAAAALQDGAEEAVKAAYARLCQLVNTLLSGHPSAEKALARYQAAPLAGEVQLAAWLTEVGAAADSQLVIAARELLFLVDDAGNFSAMAHAFKGGQFGSRNIMVNNFYSGHRPHQADAPGSIVEPEHPAPDPGKDLNGGPFFGMGKAGTAQGRGWSAGFSGALAYSLGEFPAMEDSAFRNLFLRRVREQLGMPTALRTSPHRDARAHILAIVFACQDHEDPAAAVRALHDVMAELDPGTARLSLLQDCYWTISGMTALGIERLFSVLDIIAPLSRECDTITVHEIAREVALDGEIPSLKGAGDLSSVVRALNIARLSGSSQIPLVVRFLARLASRVGGTVGARLEEQLGELLRELGVAGDELDGLRSAGTPDDSARVLQISVEEDSSPGNPRYAIKAAVFRAAPGSRCEIMAWGCGEDCSPEDLHDVGGRFLEQAGGLGQSLGEARDLVVEFLLPWRLLGQPVERWSLDEDGFWIGHTFPVVVRSLDRQRKESFYLGWRRRWDLLWGENAGKPVSEQIGWLYDGHGAVPEHAARAGRVIRLAGRNALTQWLEKDENCATAALGLTFAYAPDDPVSLGSLKAAVHEGIPLLVWLRGGSDVRQLEHMLEDVDIADLPGRILKWRRQTADSEESTADPRYHVVLLWDDPSDVSRPSGRRFAAPR